MITRITKILFIAVLLFFIEGSVFAQEKRPASVRGKDRNFSKGNFSQSSTFKKGAAAKGPTGIPDPDGGGGGSPMPISSGLAFLLVGSVVYFGKRVRDENK